MENKYITVAYKLYSIEDGERDFVEEAPAEHPFQFISGLGMTLDAFESQLPECWRQIRLHHRSSRRLWRIRRRSRY